MNQLPSLSSLGSDTLSIIAKQMSIVDCARLRAVCRYLRVKIHDYAAPIRWLHNNASVKTTYHPSIGNTGRRAEARIYVRNDVQWYGYSLMIRARTPKIIGYDAGWIFQTLIDADAPVDVLKGFNSILHTPLGPEEVEELLRYPPISLPVFDWLSDELERLVPRKKSTFTRRSSKKDDDDDEDYFTPPTKRRK